MKTHKNLFENVHDFRNLNNAYMKARRGKSDRPEVAKFTYYLEQELFNIQKQLTEGNFKTGKYRNFTIFEPKKREISALPFRDRVVHHAICNIIEPIFERTFIYDSFACREKKGTHAGVKRLQKFIIKNQNCYVLKADISKYFKTVNKDILKELLRRKIADKQVLNLLDNIVESSENGIPIGNLTSQLFANIYLSQIDYYVKFELRIKYYVRYMDDFIIIDYSKKNLSVIKDKIIQRLSLLKLSISQRKTNIFPASDSVDFLGYKIFHNHLLVRKNTVKIFLGRVKKKIKAYNYDIISFEKLSESFSSWYAYMNFADTHLLKKSLKERYFKNVI